MSTTPAEHASSNTDPTHLASAKDEVQKALIAQAIWTDVHWLMPTQRTVTVTVTGDRIEVDLDDASTGA